MDTYLIVFNRNKAACGSVTGVDLITDVVKCLKNK